MSKLVKQLIDYDAQHSAGAGTSLQEKLLLYSLIREFKPKSVVEIGVSAGHMTCWLAAALEENGEGHLLSIDDWSRAHGGAATNERAAQLRLQSNDLGHRVTFLGQSSQVWLPKQTNQSYDFVWVDGHHGEPEAMRDVNHALRVARLFVGVHDVCQQYPGPRLACEGRAGFWVRGGRGTWLRNVGEES